MIGTHLTISSRVTIIFGIASQRAVFRVKMKLKAFGRSRERHGSNAGRDKR